jgi:hypothetical protein
MKSIALYYKNSNYDGPVEFHINLWKVKQGSVIRPQFAYFFDFVIMLTQQIKELYLYLPFKISGEVTDLGEKLSTDQALTSAVFNEFVQLQNTPNCFTQVTIDKEGIQNSENKFYIYILGKENIEKTDFCEGDETGTYIHVNIKDEASIKENPYYVRFRVKVEKASSILLRRNLSNDLFQSAFSSSDMFDIRINEKRELHKKVIEKMKTDGYVPCVFDKIHFFYIVDYSENVVNGSSLKIDSRQLEQDHWKQYMPMSIQTNPIYIAHHWKRRVKENEFESNRSNNDESKVQSNPESKTCKKEKPLTSFSLFFSTTYPDIDYVRVLVYLTVILILNISGGILLSICENQGVWVLIFLSSCVVCYIFCRYFYVVCPQLKRK